MVADEWTAWSVIVIGRADPADVRRRQAFASAEWRSAMAFRWAHVNESVGGTTTSVRSRARFTSPSLQGSLRPNGCCHALLGPLCFLCASVYVPLCAALSCVKSTPMSVPPPAALMSGLPAERAPLVVLIPAAAADG